MAISDADRPLRAIQILILLPTIALTVATSASLSHPYFALISIPVLASAIFGICLLHPSAKPSRWTILTDTALALTLIGMLIPYWVGITEGWGSYWGYSHATSILGTFGSFFPMLSFCIHSYFAIRPVYPALVAYMTASFGTRTCPHCQREISTTDPRLLWDLTPGGSGRSSTHSQDSKKTAYAKVPIAEPANADESTTPRPSTDDEAARLV